MQRTTLCQFIYTTLYFRIKKRRTYVMLCGAGLAAFQYHQHSVPGKLSRCISNIHTGTQQSGGVAVLLFSVCWCFKTKKNVYRYALKTKACLHRGGQGTTPVTTAVRVFGELPNYVGLENI